MEAVARLRNYPTSPRKMRLVADLIRGREASDALIELEFNTKHSSTPLRKLLLSAISNWKQKNNQEGTEGLFVKRIFVDEARSLKRMLPAPQGRAYRIKKRSNHVTIVVDVKEGIPVANATPQTEQPATAPAPVKKTTKKKTEATK